jgi:hypothetical protein
MNRRFVSVARAAAIVLLAALHPLAAGAQDDLPGRVGRLADVGGRVYLSTEERADDWIEALRNDSVTSGDNVWVAEDGRAEIDYGGGQFRLAGDTNVNIARLDDRMLSLFVAHGRVIVRVRVLDSGEAARVDTPNTQVVLTRPGLYRIEVSGDRERTSLVVREGEATVSLAAAVQQVLPGQTASVVGEQPDYAEVRAGFATDGFDAWSADRDRRYERSRSATYVSRQMIGYADLDEHGRWETLPEYGAVWYPTSVQDDWAPYRYGRWNWVAGFGWTWVDDAPWGYAPFHYGRWIHVGNRWGWCPGHYVARPAWAPALVGWYGGSGWSASVHVGAPAYGWVPLAWGEPYIPGWRGCSDRCWTRYNRPYAVNRAERPHAPPTRYANWTAPGGITAVAGATFTGRKPVHANVLNLPRQAIANAPVLSQAPVLAKPSAQTVGAKPTVNAPPPAAQFRRPLPVAPAAGTTAGETRELRGTRGAPPSGTFAVPPASPGYARPSTPQPGTAGAPPAGYGPRAPMSAPNRAESPPALRGNVVAPAPVPPAVRASPPPVRTAPGQVQATPAPVRASPPPAQTTVQPMRPSTPAVVPRSAPPTVVPRSAPPAAAPPAVAPAPVPSRAPPSAQGGTPAGPVVRSVPPAQQEAPQRPVPQRGGDKPTVPR